MKNNKVRVMIGSSEYSTFITEKKGTRGILFDGTIIETGVTPKESLMKLEDRLDDTMYSKPVALVKKIKRRIIKR